MTISLSSLDGLNQFDNLRFHVSDLEKALFHPRDIAEFEANHPDLFPKGAAPQESQRVAELEKGLADAQDEIKRLTGKLQAKDDEITCLTEELERLKAEQPATPKTAPASEGKAASDVERWKGYAVIIAKVAHDCGAQNRKGVTRTKYRELAKTHGYVPESAIDVLREALPEITQTTAGAPPQG